MNKEEFLRKLRESLSCINEKDREASVEYYSEMIDDRMEEGVPEDEAVAAVGTIDEISAKIISTTPLIELAAERIKPKRKLEAWEIILIILGAPLWIPLIIAAFAVLLSVFIVMWSVAISLYAADLAFAVFGAVRIVFGFVSLRGLALPASLINMAFGIIGIGISILLFFGTNQVSKGIGFLCSKIIMCIKNLLTGRRKTA